MHPLVSTSGLRTRFTLQIRRGTSERGKPVELPVKVLICVSLSQRPSLGPIWHINLRWGALRVFSLLNLPRFIFSGLENGKTENEPLFAFSLLSLTALLLIIARKHTFWIFPCKTDIGGPPFIKRWKKLCAKFELDPLEMDRISPSIPGSEGLLAQMLDSRLQGCVCPVQHASGKLKRIRLYLLCLLPYTLFSSSCLPSSQTGWWVQFLSGLIFSLCTIHISIKAPLHQTLSA